MVWFDTLIIVALLVFGIPILIAVMLDVAPIVKATIEAIIEVYIKKD